MGPLLQADDASRRDIKQLITAAGKRRLRISMAVPSINPFGRLGVTEQVFESAGASNDRTDLRLGHQPSLCQLIESTALGFGPGCEGFNDVVMGIRHIGLYTSIGFATGTGWGRLSTPVFAS